MYDINQIINREGNTPEADLLELGYWSEEVAKSLAEEEGINMSQEHWEVVNFIRDYYQRCGPCPNGRTAQGLLEENFARQGGKKHLYHLFPRGPVVQAFKIAGLPLPAYSTDPHFGSVM